MWSAHLAASISEQYQTLGGHSGRPSVLLGSLLTGSGVMGISGDRYRTTMGVIVIGLRTGQSVGENIRCTWECRGRNIVIPRNL